MPVPALQNPDDRPARKSKTATAAYVWIVLAIAVLVSAVTLVMVRSERLTRERAGTQAQTSQIQSDGSSSLIEFTPSDVTVKNGWTILSGHHPTVTFTCRLAPSAPPARVAVLSYRPAGAQEWLTAEGHPRRDGTCRITLRDLSRNMPYECFFVVPTSDTVLRSAIVGFTTSPQN